MSGAARLRRDQGCETGDQGRGFTRWSILECAAPRLANAVHIDALVWEASRLVSHRTWKRIITASARVSIHFHARSEPTTGVSRPTKLDDC